MNWALAEQYFLQDAPTDLIERITVGPLVAQLTWPTWGSDPQYKLFPPNCTLDEIRFELTGMGTNLSTPKASAASTSAGRSATPSQSPNPRRPRYACSHYAELLVGEISPPSMTGGVNRSPQPSFRVPSENQMHQIPTGTELARPFVPAKDFERSRNFYEAIGFRKLLDSEVVIFAAGSSGFILQRYYQKDWAENFMMQLMVDDLDAWWAHIESLDLPGRFGVAPPKPPALQPWGLRVAYVFDPSGVLWHVANAVQAPCKIQKQPSRMGYPRGGNHRSHSRSCHASDGFRRAGTHPTAFVTFVVTIPRHQCGFHFRC